MDPKSSTHMVHGLLLLYKYHKKISLKGQPTRFYISFKKAKTLRESMVGWSFY